MKRRLRRGADVTLTRILCWGWTKVFLLPLCNVLFQCGCTWPWAGGISPCNIYDATLPDCPWCTAPGWAAWLPVQGTIVVMAAAQIGVMYSW